MLYYAAFIVLMVVSLAAALVIVGRKFPQVTLIDTETLPMEREARRKKQILKQRVGRHTADWWRRRIESVVPHATKVRTRFRALYGRMLVLDSQYTRPKELTREDIAEKVDTLLRQAERQMEEGRLDEAERTYVKVISLDKKNTNAYGGLGDIYTATKQYEQAREMFGFLVRLSVRNCLFRRVGKREQRAMPVRAALVHADDCPAPAEDHAAAAKNYAKYGKTFEIAGDAEGARLAYEQAVRFERSNPRYLDLLLEACILEGDRKRAEEVYAALAEVNPENQKLVSFRERVDALARTTAKG